MKSTYRIPHITAIILLFFTSLMSCNKHLDLVPVSTISNASFWRTEDDANGALAGMYVQLREYAQLNLFLLGEARGETLHSDGLVGDTYQRYHQNYLDATVYPGPSWIGLYKVINTANLIIKYADNISFRSASSKNQLLAEAYAMRAFVYFVLARTWGDVPLRTEPTESYNPDVTYLAKSSQADVFARIKLDLDEALTLFGENNTFKEGRCFWSRPAVNALRADVYLWTAKRLNGGRPDFEIALSAGQAVSQADVDLLEDYGSIFDYTNKGNKEIVMAVRFQQHEVEYNYFREMYMPSSVLPSGLPQEVLDLIGVTGGNIILSPSPELRAQFQGSDYRGKVSILTIRNQSTNEYFASIPLKGQGLVDAGVRYFVDDVILYRYADVLLLIAEAKNGLGLDPSDEINLVRERAYRENFEPHRFVNGTIAENDSEILRERFLELCFEGKRWWDLVRFGKTFELVPSLEDREEEEHLIYFPIPASVLSLEPLVKQIDGYDE